MTSPAVWGCDARNDMPTRPVARTSEPDRERIADAESPREERRPWYEAYAGRRWSVVLAGIVVAADLLFVGAALGGAGPSHIIPVATLFVGTVTAAGALVTA